jgi:hypothetical protein
MAMSMSMQETHPNPATQPPNELHIHPTHHHQKNNTISLLQQIHKIHLQFYSFLPTPTYSYLHTASSPVHSSAVNALSQKQTNKQTKNSIPTPTPTPPTNPNTNPLIRIQRLCVLKTKTKE